MSTLKPLALVLAVLVISSAAFAQSERGTISGTVTDSTGAVVPGAKVTVTNPATNVTIAVTTTDTGTFTVPSLLAGEYSVRAEKEGFKPVIRTGVNLSTASTVRADITLEV